MALMFQPDAAGVSLVRPSPNFRPRMAAERVRAVVIHATWMASDEDALARLCDPAAEVSCHYYVCRDGRVVQLVPEAMVAWHAGKSCWTFGDGLFVDGLNPWSLGIEVGNAGPFAVSPTPEEECAGGLLWDRAEAFREEQYGALEALLRDILGRYPEVTSAGVLGHDAVSPGRKTDPGPHFDWQRLAAAGVASFPLKS